MLIFDIGTHNHVNAVRTLASVIDKWIPNVAKHLKYAGYQTAMIGKWHLGEGPQHEPQGFDYWFAEASCLFMILQYGANYSIGPFYLVKEYTTIPSS